MPDWSVQVPDGLARLGKRLGGRAGDVIRDFYNELRRDLIVLITDEFKDAFENPDQFGFPPLSEAWLQEKVREGLDDRLWRATNTLFEGLKIVTKPDGIAVGWDNTPHPESGEPLATIAAALEYGVADLNIPARPLVGETLKRVRSKVRPLTLRLLKKHLRRLFAP